MFKTQISVVFENFVWFSTLIKDTPIALFFMLFFKVSQILLTNWWGRTKTKMSAPFVASSKSGTATYTTKNVNINQ